MASAEQANEESKSNAVGFNRSTLIPRSPLKNPANQPTTLKVKVAIDPQYYTKRVDIACNGCEVGDEHTKLICAQCKRWWHIGCQKGNDFKAPTINEGKWECLLCLRPEAVNLISDDSGDLTRVELPQNTLILGQPLNKEMQSTMLPPGDQNTQPSVSDLLRVPGTSTEKFKPRGEEYHSVKDTGSKRSNDSQRRNQVMADRVLAEKLALIEKRNEWMKRKILLESEDKLLEAEMECLREKERAISLASGSSHSSNKSIRTSLMIGAEEQLISVEKCQEWVGSVQRHPVTPIVKPVKKSVPREETTLRFLSPDMTIDQFLDSTLHGTYDHSANKLSKDQMRARKTLSHDLPIFTGNPKDWPYFISKFRDTTQMCGFSEIENLDRLQKCLKGDALENVKCDLMTTKSLASVLSTLKLLYGRPTAIFNALVDEIRKSPPVKAEKLETLVVYAMKVKNLCATMLAASMEVYLNNPSLLSEMIDKLPPALKMLWGDYITQGGIPSSSITIELFSEWLRARAESASAVFSLTPSPSTSDHQNSGSKHEKGEKFQGVHHGNNNKSDSSKSSKWEVRCHYCRETGHVTKCCTEFANLTTSKRWYSVKRANLCVRCLGKHQLHQCGSDELCGKDGCDQPHHPLLHSARSDNNEKMVATIEETKIQPSETEDRSDKVLAIHNSSRTTMFQVVPVCLVGKNGEEIRTHAFLDNGSEVTLIEHGIAKKLGCKGPIESLKLKWTGDMSRHEANSMRVNLMIYDEQRTDSFPMRNVRTVEKLELPLQSMSSAKLQAFGHLKLIPIVDYKEVKPKILIGLDNYQLMTPQEVVEGAWNEPVAMRTRLGWCIYGTPAASDNAGHQINVHVQDKVDLHELVNKYFHIESLGIVQPKVQLDTLENMRATKILEQTVRQLSDGSYEAGLLWKDDHRHFPKSRNMAIKRWQSLERSLIRKPTLMQEVINKMNEYYENQFLENINEDSDVNNSNCNVWYLPIFPVINPNKPGKLRLVWDAAATVNDVSLNSHLLSGPDLNATLLEVLSKFREHKFAVGGDIEKIVPSGENM